MFTQIGSVAIETVSIELAPKRLSSANLRLGSGVSASASPSSQLIRAEDLTAFEREEYNFGRWPGAGPRQQAPDPSIANRRRSASTFPDLLRHRRRLQTAKIVPHSPDHILFAPQPL
jgi:hypothetical protein